MDISRGVGLQQSCRRIKKRVSRIQQGIKLEILTLSVENVIDLKAVSHFILVIEMVILSQVSRLGVSQPNFGIFIGEVHLGRVLFGRDNPTNLVDYVPHSGEIPQKPITTIFRTIIGVQRIGCLIHHIIIPGDWV